MKMAKPTKREIEIALQLSVYLEGLRDGERRLPAEGKQPGDEDYWSDIAEAFDSERCDDCRQAVEQIITLAGRSAWMIPMAYATVASEKNAIIDPDSDTLELHPRIVAALNAVEAEVDHA